MQSAYCSKMYLENKLGGEKPAMCVGEKGADGGGGCGIPGPIPPWKPPWLALVAGGDERPGIIELIELGDVPLEIEKTNGLL